ncbi:MAG: hypothetical protein WC969_12295 [Elusimicrobiota bacterium]|jgi:hypothetical protein
MMRAALLLVVLGAVPARAGLLTAQGVAVLDASRSPRASFSNNERITFQVKIHNGAASANRIVFRFSVLAPTGAQVFEHAGNAVPGSVGNAASQVSGISIAGFYGGPGVYRLLAQASLDGATVEQTADFTVSSPNILLIYPPNGALDLADSPLTFRWVASGSTRYRVTVGDNPSLYNALFSQETSGAENYLTYPQNPSDARQRLAAGQVYWWKVEGLDPSGNVAGASASPYSFSVKSSAMARDLAVLSLEISGPPVGGALPFRVVVKDQGNTSEANVPLRFSLGGLPAAGSPVSLSLSPGDERTFDFTASLPVDQGESLAIACVELFDDTVANNCKTLQVSRPPSASTGTAGGTIFGPTGPMTPDQVWAAVRELLRDRGIVDILDDYTLVGMDGDLTADQLAALLDALRQDQANVSLTGPAPGAPPPSASLIPPVSSLPGVGAPPSEEGERAAVSEEAEREGPTAEDVWQALRGLLRGREDVADLEDYSLVGMDGELSDEELSGLGDALREGRASVSVTGPGEEIPAVAGPVEDSLAPLEEPRADVRPAVPVGSEWWGFTVAPAKDMRTLVVEDEKTWRRVWRQTGEDEVPDVDFREHVVLALTAPRVRRAASVEIVEIRRGLAGTVVRYRLVREAPAPQVGGKRENRPQGPFRMRVVRRLGGRVVFEEVEKGGE